MHAEGAQFRKRERGGEGLDTVGRERERAVPLWGRGGAMWRRTLASMSCTAMSSSSSSSCQDSGVTSMPRFARQASAMAAVSSSLLPDCLDETASWKLLFRGNFGGLVLSCLNADFLRSDTPWNYELENV